MQPSELQAKTIKLFQGPNNEMKTFEGAIADLNFHCT